MSRLPYGEPNIIKQKHVRDKLTRKKAVENVDKWLGRPFVKAAERGNTKYRSKAYRSHAYYYVRCE